MDQIRDAELAITGGSLEDVEQGVSDLHKHMHANPKAFYNAERNAWLKGMTKRLQAVAARMADLVRG